MWKLIEVFVTAHKEDRDERRRQEEELRQYLQDDYEPFQVKRVPDGTYYHLRKHKEELLLG